MNPLRLALALCLLATTAFPAQADDAYIQALNADADAWSVACALTRSKISSFPTVQYVAAKSPATLAGIKVGDPVSAIDGVSTQHMSVSAAHEKLNGKVGSPLALTVSHPGEPDEHFAFTRQSPLDTYQPAASDGDARAQYYVAMFYRRGPIETRNLPQAYAWYRKSAEQGYAPAQRNLARGFLLGLGGQANAKEAAVWYLKAAIQDDSTAQDQLATLYRTGNGVEQNLTAAFAWYYRSALTGSASGTWNLARMYDKGLGVKPDIEEALRWYQYAQIINPGNPQLKLDIAIASLRVFFETPTSAVMRTSDIVSALGPAAWVVLLFLTLLYLAGGTALIVPTWKTSDPLSPWLALGWMAFYMESQAVATVAALLFFQTLTVTLLLAAILVASAVPLILSSVGAQRARLWKPPALSWPALGGYLAASAATIIALGWAFSELYPIFAHAPIPAQPTKVLVDRAFAESPFVACLAIAIALPACEELLFRGFLFDALSHRYSTGVTLVVSSVAFSLFHFQIIYLFPLFALGLVLAFLRLKTKSLVASVVLHVTNNLMFLIFAR